MSQPLTKPKGTGPGIWERVEVTDAILKESLRMGGKTEALVNHAKFPGVQISKTDGGIFIFWNGSEVYVPDGNIKHLVLR